MTDIHKKDLKTHKCVCEIFLLMREGCQCEGKSTEDTYMGDSEYPDGTIYPAVWGGNPYTLPPTVPLGCAPIIAKYGNKKVIRTLHEIFADRDIFIGREVKPMNGSNIQGTLKNITQRPTGGIEMEYLMEIEDDGKTYFQILEYFITIEIT